MPHDSRLRVHRPRHGGQRSTYARLDRADHRILAEGRPDDLRLPLDRVSGRGWRHGAPAQLLRHTHHRGHRRNTHAIHPPDIKPPPLRTGPNRTDDLRARTARGAQRTPHNRDIARRRAALRGQRRPDRRGRAQALRPRRRDPLRQPPRPRAPHYAPMGVAEHNREVDQPRRLHNTHHRGHRPHILLPRHALPPRHRI